MFYPRTIVEESQQNIIVLDVFSKLIESRIIFIDSEITDTLANAVIAQMLYLDSVSNSPINVYINSPGGYVHQGLAIWDVASRLSSPIHTYALGQCASMAAVLLLMGKKRFGTKHARIMFHQVSGFEHGTIADIKIGFEESKYLQDSIFDIIKSNTNITDPEVRFQRDFWISSKEALTLGILTDEL